MRRLKQNVSVVLKDNNHIKNVIVQVNLKNGSAMVVSAFSAWENLAYIMEALSVTAEQCVAEGMNKKEVYEEIVEYLKEALPAYEHQNRVIN